MELWILFENKFTKYNIYSNELHKLFEIEYWGKDSRYIEYFVV